MKDILSLVLIPLLLGVFISVIVAIINCCLSKRNTIKGRIFNVVAQSAEVNDKNHRYSKIQILMRPEQDDVFLDHYKDFFRESIVDIRGMANTEGTNNE